MKGKERKSEEMLLRGINRIKKMGKGQRKNIRTSEKCWSEERKRRRERSRKKKIFWWRKIKRKFGGKI